MSEIIRVAKRDRFTIVCNETVRDERLSFRATGVLVYLLSLPDNWTVDSDEIARHKSEGRDAVRTALAELEQLGYLKRDRRRNAKGQWEGVSVVYERPRADKPTPDIQASDNQATDSQALKEDPQTITEEEVTTTKQQTIVSNTINSESEEFQTQGEVEERELERDEVTSSLESLSRQVHYSQLFEALSIFHSRLNEEESALVSLLEDFGIDYERAEELSKQVLKASKHKDELITVLESEGRRLPN